MDFDPDAFIAQAEQTPSPVQMTQPEPNAEQPSFDPDAFIQHAEGEKYGTPKQQAIAGVEGIASGVLGPVAPLIEKNFGVKAEDILAREKANPITHGVGQAVGLTGGLFTGTGEAAVMTKAGELASEALGLAKPASYIAKVGSSAVQQAAEMAVLESGDQAAHMILKDPETSAQSAISNIGMASALGGGVGAFVTGAVSPLWKATIGSKTEQFLSSMSQRLGVEGGLPATAQELATKAGVEVPSEFQAVIDRKPGAMAIHSNLSQNDVSLAGRKYQKNLSELQENLGNKIGEILGKTPEELSNITPVDKYTSGGQLGQTLAKEVKQQYAPIEAEYRAVEDKFKNLPISVTDTQGIADRIAQKSIEEGWRKAESGVAAQFAERTIESLKKQDNINDLKLFMTNIEKQNPYGSPTYDAAKKVNSIIRNSQEGVIASQLGGEELAAYNDLRSRYSGMKSDLEGLNNHLHLGKNALNGAGSFIKSLDKLSTSNGEALLNRLSGKTKANILEVLQKYPETLQKVRDFHVGNLLGEATSKAAPGTSMNVNNLNSNIEKLSPQIRDLILSPEKAESLKAVNQIVESLKDPNHNFSNTARTAHNLLQDAPTALSVVMGLFGHGGLGLLTYLSKLGYQEGTPALKYGMLKFLSSNQPVKAEGFKAMTQYMSNAVKGEMKLAKATEGVFKTGTLAAMAASPLKARASLDKVIQQFKVNPEMIFKAAGNEGSAGYYMPEHQSFLTQTVTSNLQYLQSLKPEPYRSSPLDKEIEPSPQQMERYNRALDISNNPMMVLQKVKDGTIQISDMQDLKSMYPALYSKMSQQLSDNMINKHSDGELIPYKTRMGLSLFLGQPIDSSMKPESILSAQPKPKAQPVMQNGQENKPKGSSTKNLGKDVKSYMTPDQASSARKANND